MSDSDRNGVFMRKKMNTVRKCFDAGGSTAVVAEADSRLGALIQESAMQRLVWTFIIAGLFCGVIHQNAEAQMFGARNFGSNLQPQTNPGGGSFGGPTPAPGIGSGGGPVAPSATSVATPDARFMRRNRTASDFVGKDTKDARKVVGGLPTGQVGNSQPAAMEVFERRVPESLLNPSRQPSTRTRMYEPKLVIGFRQPPRSTSAVSANLQNQIRQLTEINPSIQVSMFVAGETVHLQGEVGSEEERALIEQLMLFEPGISSVRNDLRVPVGDPPVPAEM